MTEPNELEQSRRFCQYVTRKQAGNFYYGLRLLPPAKRQAMFALYAYMRTVDDIADADDGREPAQRLEELEQWRQHTHAALAGESGSLNDSPIWPAFCELVHHHSIPSLVFDEVIAGQRQDLEPVAFENFEQLRQYCYRVAGVVGLACVYIWGFEGGAATEAMAIDRGVAFQLTNILRDLREDAARGRSYLPRNEVTDLLNGGGDAFIRMMHAQIERAESYYEKSARLEAHIATDSRATLMAMTAIYRGILNKVRRRPESVLQRRISLSLPSKLLIGWRAVRENRATRAGD